MEEVFIVTTFIFVLLFIIVIGYHMYYVLNIRHITKQLKEIIEVKDTNEILTVVANQKDIANLVNVLNDLIIDIRKSRIKINKVTRKFRESIINISHDLRTPLTTASGYVQMLQSDISEEEREEFIKIILERQDMVKILIEQLFEYVRIEAGEITYKNYMVDAKKIFIETLAMYYDDFNSKGEEPVIHLPDKKCIISGDEQGIKRIFSNILFNALRHGEGSYSFEITESTNNYIFRFSNKSEPLTIEDTDRIFDRFYTKDKSRNNKTTGLGLAIAKEITKKMNGKIEASYDKGIFTIKVYFPKKD